MFAMVCDVYFSFSKFYNSIKGIMRIYIVYIRPLYRTIVFILNSLGYIFITVNRKNLSFFEKVNN